MNLKTTGAFQTACLVLTSFVSQAAFADFLRVDCPKVPGVKFYGGGYADSSVDPSQANLDGDRIVQAIAGRGWVVSKVKDGIHSTVNSMSLSGVQASFKHPTNARYSALLDVLPGGVSTFKTIRDAGLPAERVLRTVSSSACSIVDGCTYLEEQTPILQAKEDRLRAVWHSVVLKRRGALLTQVAAQSKIISNADGNINYLMSRPTKCSKNSYVLEGYPVNLTEVDRPDLKITFNVQTIYGGQECYTTYGNYCNYPYYFESGPYGSSYDYCCKDDYDYRVTRNYCTRDNGRIAQFEAIKSKARAARTKFQNWIAYPTTDPSIAQYSRNVTAARNAVLANLQLRVDKCSLSPTAIESLPGLSPALPEGFEIDNGEEAPAPQQQQQAEEEEGAEALPL